MSIFKELVMALLFLLLGYILGAFSAFSFFGALNQVDFNWAQTGPAWLWLILNLFLAVIFAIMKRNWRDLLYLQPGFAVFVYHVWTRQPELGIWLGLIQVLTVILSMLALTGLRRKFK